MRISPTTSRLPRLADTFSPTANSVGFLRLALAGAVLVSHVGPLGYGRGDVGLNLTHGQTSLGALGVDGFFVLSGFLVTGSGLKLRVPRFAWHRALRIFPGLWVCLLVTAFAIAPIVSLIERGTTSALWRSQQGPLSYVLANWWGGVRQWPIAGLLTTTPYGRVNPWGGSAFDGSLWSLVYELVCYALVGTLALATVLRRMPAVVPLLTIGVFGVVVADYVGGAGRYSGPLGHGSVGPLPLIGSLDLQSLLYLGFLFLLGMTARLYQQHVPMHPALAGVAGAMVVGSMAFGAFYVVGVPAFAYLVLWAATALPRRLHEVGRQRDYSYGVYIYAFPVQQVLALIGGARWGVIAYLLLSAAGTALLAAASWHWVERPALSLKNWRPPRRHVQPAPTETAAAES